MRPQARERGLLIRHLGKELVVYDLARHQAHCLDPSAAAVFKRCDGRSTTRELSVALREELGPGVDDRWIVLALEGLDQAHLLEPDSVPTVPSPIGRRDALRQAGLGAALLLPVVISMVAPTTAEAAGTCIPQAACTGREGQPCYIPPGDEECATHRCDGVSGLCVP